MKIEVQPVEAQKAKPAVATLGFGKYFSDRMFTQRYTPEQGWHDARIEPYRPFVLDPATMVFHYSQEIFEGLKAYRTPEG
ncbi:MAG TPA: branched chain amino acid aminotransferase, partial [Anaerolineae bacterium]